MGQILSGFAERRKAVFHFGGNEISGIRTFASGGWGGSICSKLNSMIRYFKLVIKSFEFIDEAQLISLLYLTLDQKEP